MCGHVEIARLLIDHGADVNCSDFHQWTPLTIAAHSGHTSVCNLLLQRGASTESRNLVSMTAIHLAVTTSNMELLQSLCRWGADVNAHGLQGKTAVHIAFQQNLPHFLFYLMDHGASVDAVDNDGTTVLVHACLMGDEKFAGKLFERLDEAEATDTKYSLLNKPRGRTASTPLNVAAQCGNLSLVSFLVDHGADLDLKDAIGRSPLTTAASLGHEGVVKFLLSRGADTEATEIHEHTSLALASSRGFESIVDMLLEQGANTDHRGMNGASALHEAAMAGHASIVKSLLKYGHADIRSDGGWTPLMTAVQSQRLEVTRLLIDNGADIDCQSYDHWTPLMVAGRNSDTEICMLLIEKGASITIQGNEGHTVLHVAAMNGLSAIIGVLMAKGVDHHVRDFQGRTAAHVAMLAGHFAAAELLDPELEATETEFYDDPVWPRHSLRELYGHNNACPAVTLGHNPPWYIDRSSIAAIELCPHLTTPAAQVSVGKWGGSRVLIVEPITSILQLFVMEMEIKRLFRSQVSRLYPLRHLHVIKLYGACHRGEKPFLVIEHPQNGTLRSFVAENKHRTWATLHEVALGVQYLHERGIVHGSLIGDSILIGDDGLAKLSAIGLFSEFTDMFTLPWQAPEIVDNKNRMVETDIYALGMCIVEAVSGKVPYAQEQSEQQDLKTLIKKGILPERPAGFNTRGWELVQQMISFHPRKRLKISEVVRELAALAQDETSNVHSWPVDRACAIISRSDTHEAFVRTLSLLNISDTGGGSCGDETPQRQVFHRLHDVWQASESLPSPEVQEILYRLHDILSRFKNDLEALASKSHAASFAAQRKHADRVFSFHNEIDRLLAQHGDLSRSLTTAATAVTTSTHSWRARWFEHRRSQLLVFGAFLERLSELDIETSTCLLFELTKRSNAYSSIPPTTVNVACWSMRAKPGVRLPDWFIPHYDVVFDEFQSFSRGAFGSVHHGEWVGSRVVVKKVFAEDDAEFEKEVELWSQLYHPHVLQLFGASHVGQKFLVSEFAEHGQLDSYLRGLPQHSARRKRELWRTLHEAALGLHYLHSRGIVHCDLKCNNILIGRDGKAKVSDYGLSRKQHHVQDEVVKTASQEDDNHRAGADRPTGAGAPRWKAPEVLSGAEPTAASDIYSFGMCVVEAVTGEYPWGMTLLDGVVSDHVRGGGALFDKPAAFSDTQWAVVGGACRFDPVERLSLGEIVMRLEACADEATKRGGDDAFSCALVGVAEPEPEAKVTWGDSAASVDVTPTPAASKSYSDSW